MREKLSQHLTELVLLAATFAVFGITALFNDAYTARFSYNLTLILHHAAILGIFSLGAAVVIISGGIDLSSSSMIALGGSLVCLFLLVTGSWINPEAADPTENLPIWLIGAAILFTLLIGLLVGTLHTWLITVIELPPFVATLASLVGLRSLAIIMNKAVSKQMGTQQVKVNIQDPKFYAIGHEWWVPVVIFLALALGLFIFLNFTVTGRHIYAMGGNEEAAKISGVRTDRLKWLAYGFAAVTAALAGVLYSSDIQQANPESMGMGYELFAIAAAVIGGCSLAGGIGRVSGVVLGALFLRVVIDAVAKLIRAGSDDYEGMIVGLLVVLAVAFNQVTSSKQGWRKQFFPGVLGVIAIVTVSLLFGAVSLFSVQLASTERDFSVGLIAAGIVALTLFSIKALSAFLNRKA